MSISSSQRPVQPTGNLTGTPFDIVRRGYDRDQVDAQLRELRDRLSAAEVARVNAETHARATEDELRTARTQGPAEGASSDSFGFRAEKILRLAEHEAADVRSRAANEATALVEQARADAERHRHDVEQKLIARSAEMDQEAAQRNVSLTEREQQAAATLAAARDEAARITSDAERTAESLVGDARARAEEVRQRSEQDTRRRRDAAEQELRRIGSVHEGVRAEMARLHTLLGGELGSGQAAAGATKAPAPPTSTPSHAPSTPKPGPGPTAGGNGARHASTTH